MSITVSSEEAEKTLNHLIDVVTQQNEVVIIRRSDSKDAALIAAGELSSIMETLHLLRSPANARRLFDALESAQRGEGIPMTVEELRHEFGLDDESADG